MTVKFFIKKFTIFLFSIFLVISLTFVLMHSLPGNPFMDEQAMPFEVLQSLKRYHGLDQPLLKQYLYYLNHIFSFDFGYSLKYQGRTVVQIISESFPISLALGIQAFLFAFIGGLFSGAIASIYQQKWQERGILLLTVLGLSIPAFLFAPLLQYLFAMQLDWFPVARWGSFAHTILPSVALSLFPFAYIARLTHASMLEVLKQDYILIARSKGLGKFEIIHKHVLRNALLPVIAYAGPLIAAIFTGSFVIEKIFGIPGLGQWLVTSINNRDYPVIMGITIFYSSILMFCNFLVDCLHYLLNPRTEIREKI